VGGGEREVQKAILVFTYGQQHVTLYTCRSILVLINTLEIGARWSNGQCARRAIAEAKHRSQWPVIGLVDQNLLSRAPPCFGRHGTARQARPRLFVNLTFDTFVNRSYLVK
jgi:hypothetical protein